MRPSHRRPVLDRTSSRPAGRTRDVPLVDGGVDRRGHAHQVDQVGESAYLARFDPDDLVAIYVRRVECTKPLRYIHELGTPIPLHAWAAGKAILAECGEDVGTVSRSALARIRW
ncbi:IclR family transcriptional regulator domain-containing protein [Amycolatopsis acidiphila]|uniref:IclR family transcriptional regulator domain-containing protein n=1 Tax=Amycolatopsis acidiphila TaxID=715473 RepID=UPI00402B6A37